MFCSEAVTIVIVRLKKKPMMVSFFLCEKKED